MCLTFQLFRFVLTINVDRELQQCLWLLPGVFVLRLGSHTGIVTIIVVNHEFMKCNIVRCAIALLERVEAKAENSHQAIHKRFWRELVVDGTILENFRI